MCSVLSLLMVLMFLFCLCLHLKHFYHFLAQPNSLVTLDLSNTDCALDQVSIQASSALEKEGLMKRIIIEMRYAAFL